jgi:hypothetical protein
MGSEETKTDLEEEEDEEEEEGEEAVEEEEEEEEENICIRTISPVTFNTYS